MSAEPTDNDGDLLAAEYALGLLEGSELAAARRLMLANRDFAESVERWSVRLVPLTDDIRPVEPGADIWTRIEDVLAASGEAVPVETETSLVTLRRRLGLWRNAALAAGAIAASLALFLATRDISAPPVPVPANVPLLAAGLASEKSGALLSVVFEPDKRSLLVTPGLLRKDAGRDHELWVIAGGDKPMSLGLVRPGAPQRLDVPMRLAPQFRPGSVIAVSVEPAGGSTTGQPTGPVIATGELSSI